MSQGAEPGEKLGGKTVDWQDLQIAHCGIAALQQLKQKLTQYEGRSAAASIKTETVTATQIAAITADANLSVI